MTNEEAAEITQLIKAATADNWVSEQTMLYFEEALRVLDFTFALEATNIGIVTWDKFPSWGKFKEIYRAQKRLAEPVGEQRDSPPARVREDPDFKRGEAAPEWVHIWFWARTVKDPSEQRGFPQQEGSTNPNDQMSTEQYEEVRSEWQRAGSPKYENPIPMAR